MADDARGLCTLECRTDEVIVHNIMHFAPTLMDVVLGRSVAGEPLRTVSVVAVTVPPVSAANNFLWSRLSFVSHSFCF